MKLAVILPAFNEENTILKVVNSIPRTFVGVRDVRVIVVDDASHDQTFERAREAGATVLRHVVNLGQGAAVLTGIHAAKRLGANLVVTLDSDGQHDPSDIGALLEELFTNQADFVVGSRFLSETINEMPSLKWYGNKVMNGITYMFSGRMMTDSQSGFRLFGGRVLELIDSFNMRGYEFCSETIVRARQLNLKVSEVPIKTIYFDHRQGQNPINGINILLRLIYRKVAG